MANLTRSNRPLLIRLCLLFCIVEGLVIGIHALFFPHYFYENFFLGAGWLKAFGMYSEHLTRDAGALYLGITVMTIDAARRLTPDYVRGVCAVQAVAAFPHMIYHIVNWRMSGFWAMIPQAGTLFLTVAIALAGLLLSLRHERESIVPPERRPAAASPATFR